MVREYQMMEDQTELFLWLWANEKIFCGPVTIRLTEGVLHLESHSQRLMDYLMTKSYKGWFELITRVGDCVFCFDLFVLRDLSGQPRRFVSCTVQLPGS